MLRTISVSGHWPTAKALAIAVITLWPPWKIIDVVASEITSTYVYNRSEIINKTFVACLWITICVSISYFLFTKRIIRTTWNEKLAHVLMWTLYICSILYMLILYIDIPSEEFKLTEPGEPFFG